MTSRVSSSAGWRASVLNWSGALLGDEQALGLEASVASKPQDRPNKARGGADDRQARRSGSNAGRRRRRYCRRSRQIPVEAHPPRDSVPAGRRRRRGRPSARPADDGDAQPVDRPRQPGRRQRQPRRRDRRQGAARRLHAAARQQLVHHQRRPLRQAAVRPGGRFRADQPRRLDAQPAGRPSLGAGADGQGVRRAGEGAPGQAELRVFRHR